VGRCRTPPAPGRAPRCRTRPRGTTAHRNSMRSPPRSGRPLRRARTRSGRPPGSNADASSRPSAACCRSRATNGTAGRAGRAGGGGLRRENVRAVRQSAQASAPERPVAAIARSDYLRSQDLNIPIMKVPDRSGIAAKIGRTMTGRDPHGRPIGDREDEGGCRVVVVDDHELFRRGIGEMLHERGRFASSAPCRRPEQVLEQIDAWEPDVVLMDLGLPGMSGCRGDPGRSAGPIRRSPSSCSARSPTRDDLMAAILAGASGYVLKSASVDDVVASVHARVGGIGRGRARARRKAPGPHPPHPFRDA